jgi:hypothetical protein
VDRRQELPVGMPLPAENQGRHFRRKSIELRSQAVSLLELQPTQYDAVDQQAFQ